MVPVLRLPEESEDEEDEELELLDGEAKEIDVLAEGADEDGPIELEPE